MPSRKHAVLILALASTATLPALAVETVKDEHTSHHPQATQTTPAQPQAAAPSVQDRRQVMRQRMQEIRATQDTDKRRQLLEAQMKDIEAMLDEGVCPMPGGGMMGPGMMGGSMKGPGMMGQGGMMGRGTPQQGMGGGVGMQRGMACGMGGCAMQPGTVGQRQADVDDAVVKRLEALEKRVDLIQTMLQMQAR